MHACMSGCVHTVSYVCIVCAPTHTSMLSLRKLNTTGLMTTVSPKLTEYGSSSDTKKSLKTLSDTMLENPIPSFLESATPSPTHVVMVSGTVAGSLPCPLDLGEHRWIANDSMLAERMGGGDYTLGVLTALTRVCMYVYRSVLTLQYSIFMSSTCVIKMSQLTME